MFIDRGSVGLTSVGFPVTLSLRIRAGASLDTGVAVSISHRLSVYLQLGYTVTVRST